MSDQLANPYVGPRTFEEDDKEFFFGRDKEARQLLSLVISERLVLFYAQSGAGKSSLLNTHLRPELAEEDFHVLPTVRVGGSLPEGIDEVDNIFVFNLIISLEAAQENATHFTHTRLTAYWQDFQENNKSVDEFGSEKARVLIIDQFEEIVTTNLDRWKDRETFFSELAAVMKADPLLWVVLTLREDHVAAIEPYARLMPGGMRKRYYMQRMKTGAALKAIKEPAEKGGRPFTPKAATQLVDNLRQLRTKIETEETETALGEFIEPVQLQVVCYQLWQNLNAQAESPTEISEEDLQKFGDVDEALSQFYESAIAKVLQQTDESELTLRKWFEEKLITEAGTRGTVYQGKETTEGMSNETVRLLADQYLLRAAPRAGGLWFELVHDRFVEPILQANQAWRLKQNPLIQAAETWDRAGRDRSLLIQDETLQTTLNLVDWDSLEPLVQDYLTESQEAQSIRDAEKTRRLAEENALRAEREARAARILRWLAIALGIAIFVAAYFAITAFIEAGDAVEARQEAEQNAQDAEAARAEAETNEADAIAAGIEAAQNAQDAEAARAEADANAEDAEEARREAVQNALEAGVAKDEAEANAQLAESLRLASASTNNLKTNPQLALLLAIEAGRRTSDVEVDRALRAALDLAQVNAILPHKASVRTLALNDNGTLLAYGGDDDEFHIRSLAGETEITLNGEEDIKELVFVPNSPYLAAIDVNQNVLIWNNDDFSWNLIQFFEELNTYSFSPDGTLVAVAVTDTIQIASISSNRVINTMDATAANLAFTPDNQWLASSSFDQPIRLWPVSDAAAEPIALPASELIIDDMFFSPDGRWLLVDNPDDTVQLWPTEEITYTTSFSEVITLDGQTALFNHDGSQLVTADFSGIRLWQDNDFQEPLFTLEDTAASGPWQLAFNRDGTFLATSGDDQEIRLWDTQTGKQVNQFSGHSGAINDLLFSNDGSILMSASDDESVYMWSTAVRKEQVALDDIDGLPTDMDISPDGSLLVLTTIESGSDSESLGSTQHFYNLTLLKGGEIDQAEMITPTIQPSLSPYSIFTADGKYLIWVDLAGIDPENSDYEGDTHLKVYEVASLLRNEAVIIKELSFPGISLSQPELSPDGQLLVVSTLFVKEESEEFRSTVNLVDIPSLMSSVDQETEATIFELETDFLAIDAHFSGDGQMLIVNELNLISEFMVNQVWHISQPVGETLVVEKRQPLVDLGYFISIDGDFLSLQSNLFSPNDTYLASFAGDTYSSDTIQIWNLNTLLSEGVTDAPVTTLPSQTSELSYAAFSPTGLLASGDESGIIRIWHIPTAETNISEAELAVLEGHQDTITKMIFDSTGSLLITSSEDGAVRLWSLNFEAIMQQACQSVSRNLTVAEYAKYLNLEADPDYKSTCANVAPHLTVIEELIRQDRSHDALTLLEEAYRLSGSSTVDPHAVMVDRLMLVGLDLAREGNADVALPTLQLAKELSPTLNISPTGIVASQLITYSMSYLQTQPDVVKSLVEEALAMDGSVSRPAARALFQSAVYFSFQNDPEEALHVLAESKNLDEELFNVLADEAMQDFGLSFFDEMQSEETYDVAKMIVGTYLLEGVRNARFQGSVSNDEALDMLLTAIDYNATLEELVEFDILQLALRFVEQDDVDVMLEALQNYVENHPESNLNPESIMAQAILAAIDQGNLENISQEFFRALDLDPSIADSLDAFLLIDSASSIAVAYGVEEALNFLNELNENYPQLNIDAEFILTQGILEASNEQARSGDTAAAISSLNWAIDNDPDFLQNNSSEVFDIFHSICGQAQSDNIDESVLYACEQAASLALQMEWVLPLEEACRNASISQEIAEVVLPACEQSLATAVAENDMRHLFALCLLSDNPGYEEFAPTACEVVNIQQIPLDDTSESIVQGTIIEPYTNEYWSFMGEEGQQITVHMNKRNSDLDAVITLLDPTGAFLITTVQIGEDDNASIQSYTLPETGIYYLSASGDVDSFGAYEIILLLEAN